MAIEIFGFNRNLSVVRQVLVSRHLLDRRKKDYYWALISALQQSYQE